MVQNQSLTTSLAPDPNCVIPPGTGLPTESHIPTMTGLEPLGDIPSFHSPCQTTHDISLTSENPSLIGNTSSFTPDLNLQALIGFSQGDVATSENMVDPFTYSLMDNQMESQLQIGSADSQSLDEIVLDNDLTKQVKPRTRNDSTESVDTVSSSSSGEIFNSAYTDTVSSTSSAAFLIKPSAESDEESQTEGDKAHDDCYNYNDGYMSYSSTEVLNDSDDGDHEELLQLPSEEVNQESCPMLTPSVLIEIDDESYPMPMEHEEDVDVGLDNEYPLGKNLNDFLHHSLSPIQENQIVSFVEEVEPRQYTKITDNLIVADESFLFNSATNLGELEFGKNGRRATTMQNIHEKSSFLDLTEISKVGRVCQKALVFLKDDMTLGSLASLNTIVAKENAKDPIQSLSLIGSTKSEGVLKKSNYMKNLFALSISIVLLYVAVGSTRNLQSSINHEGGVGVIGLAVNFVGYVVGSMFSSSIVQTYRPRRCLIVSLFPNLLYVAANLYPTMWMIVPISLIQGIALAVVSNATSTYITFLAKGCAEKTKETFSEVSGRFFGSYCLVYQTYIIVGNLIASLILAPPDDSTDVTAFTFLNATNTNNTQNLTQVYDSESGLIMSSQELPSNASSHLHLCGSGFCQHHDIGGSSFSVDMETKFLLFGVYMGCIVLSLVNAVFIMEPLNKNLFKSTVSPIKKFKSQMSSLAHFAVDPKFLLLLPLLMYSAMQFAFLSAEFIKGYIACPLGIHMIGYTMICFGICSSSSSYLCGLLSKYVGRMPFIIAASMKSLTRKLSKDLLANQAFTSLLSVCCNG